jgi:hypothetical protein
MLGGDVTDFERRCSSRLLGVPIGARQILTLEGKPWPVRLYGFGGAGFETRKVDEPPKINGAALWTSQDPVLVFEFEESKIRGGKMKLL